MTVCLRPTFMEPILPSEIVLPVESIDIDIDVWALYHTKLLSFDSIEYKNRKNLHILRMFQSLDRYCSKRRIPYQHFFLHSFHQWYADPSNILLITYEDNGRIRSHRLSYCIKLFFRKLK